MAQEWDKNWFIMVVLLHNQLLNYHKWWWTASHYEKEIIIKTKVNNLDLKTFHGNYEFFNSENKVNNHSNDHTTSKTITN